MNYYKIHDTWDNFFAFVKKRLDKDEICFMYRLTDDSQDIYIASLENNALDIIKTQYNLIECDQPENFFDNKWGYTGNHNLFEIKL